MKTRKGGIPKHAFITVLISNFKFQMSQFILKGIPSLYYRCLLFIVILYIILVNIILRKNAMIQ